MNTSLPDPDTDALIDVGTLSADARVLREWAETPDISGDRDDAPAVDRRVWLAHSVSGRECVGADMCAYGDKCFSELAKAKANSSDIVVTNHALLAIEIVDKHPILPERAAIILDEGHEFIDRTTQAVAEELSANMVSRAATFALRHLPGAQADRLLEASSKFADDMLNFRTRNQPGDDETVRNRWDELPPELFAAVSLIRDNASEFLAKLGEDEISDLDLLAERARVKGAVSEVSTTCAKLIKASKNDVMWFDANTATIRLAPLSVSDVLHRNMFSETPVVITSATLGVGGSFENTAKSLGLYSTNMAEENTECDFATLDVGSPFDFASQGMLYLPKHLPEPSREGISEESLSELADLIEAAGGRTLALFSSWRAVESASEVLRERLKKHPEINLFVQRKGDPVGVLVDKFASDTKSVLLGTIGLWQGVDVPGESCTLVVIDRIPFPRPDDPITSARAARIEEEGGNGFMSVSVPKAALMLAQGAGRLIRSSNDRGVVAILDNRIVTRRYGATLLRTMPNFWRTHDKKTILEALSRLNKSY